MCVARQSRSRRSVGLGPEGRVGGPVSVDGSSAGWAIGYRNNTDQICCEASQRPSERGREGLDGFRSWGLSVCCEAKSQSPRSGVGAGGECGRVGVC